VTEDEAFGKWCPFARPMPPRPNDPAYNRIPDDTDPVPDGAASRCIGSACMAWRKLRDADFDSHDNLPGFCGLAGKP
jgi:hypothetical protein